MSGSQCPSDGPDNLKVLADNAGIPELQAFEHDSDRIEVEQDETAERIEALELLADPYFEDRDEEPTDGLTDEDLRFERTVH